MTFIRQCAWCRAIWDWAKNEWAAHDHVIAVATHTICEDCRSNVKEEDPQT